MPQSLFVCGVRRVSLVELDFMFSLFFLCSQGRCYRRAVLLGDFPDFVANCLFKQGENSGTLTAVVAFTYSLSSGNV